MLSYLFGKVLVTFQTSGVFPAVWSNHKKLQIPKSYNPFLIVVINKPNLQAILMVTAYRRYQTYKKRVGNQAFFMVLF